jgi:hypothetical protein
MSIITTLLNNPFVQAYLVAGVGWVATKVLGKRANTKLGKATTALATSAAQMAQVAMTEPGRSAQEMVTMFKGIVAIQFAKVGFTEADRKPYQPGIDAAIAKAVKEWIERHPSPASLTVPVTAKVVPVGARDALIEPGL